MRSPPLVPGFDVDVYLVLDDFGPLGRAYRETAEDKSSRQAIIRDLIPGEINDPVRVVRFNTHAGMSEDVSIEVAKEILAWATKNDELLPLKLRDFIDFQLDLERRYQPAKASNSSISGVPRGSEGPTFDFPNRRKNRQDGMVKTTNTRERANVKSARYTKSPSLFKGTARSIARAGRRCSWQGICRERLATY